MNVLVFIETDEGKLRRSSREAITAAKGLSNVDSITAVSYNGDESALAGAGEFCATNVVNFTSADAKYSATSAAKSIKNYIESNNIDIFFASADAAGKELAPRVAGLLKAGYIADCVGLDNSSGEIIATKPVYAGKAQIKTKINSDKKVFSLRPNVFTAKSVGGNAEVSSQDADSSDMSVKITGITKNEGKLDVAEADIIVSGGRGFKGPENFNLVEDLASSLGAAVGASRAVVDAGWRPHSEQVGQTGKTVSPSLYVACAISGAVQHLAGMSSSKIIVAINKDEDAPIFKVTDYGIVGDVFEVLPKLTEKIKSIG